MSHRETPARLVSVALAPAIDRLVEVERLVPGAIHRPDRIVSVAGGKGLNVARAAARLGANVTACALLGGHAGRWVDQEMGAAGIRSVVHWTSGETRTCVSILSRADGHLTELYPSPEPVAAEDWRAFEALVRKAIEAAVVDLEAAAATRVSRGRVGVTVSGSLPLGAPPSAVARIVALAGARGALSAVDVHGPPLAAALEARPDLVKVNATEAAELIGVRTDDEEGCRQAATAMRKRGARAVVVTRGREGAIALLEDGEWRVGPPAAMGPYPVGSGDAFLAGLVVVLAAGGSFEAALHRAAGAAAANALEPGQAVFDPAAAFELGTGTVVVAGDTGTTNGPPRARQVRSACRRAAGGWSTKS